MVKSGRYASYWNAFLLAYFLDLIMLFFMVQKEFSLTPKFRLELISENCACLWIMQKTSNESKFEFIYC